MGFVGFVGVFFVFCFFLPKHEAVKMFNLVIEYPLFYLYLSQLATGSDI